MIKISEKLSIKPFDDYNWIIEEKKETKHVKTKEPCVKIVRTYYPTLKSALKSALDKDLKVCHNAEEMLKKIQDYEELVEKAFKADNIKFDKEVI